MLVVWLNIVGWVISLPFHLIPENWRNGSLLLFWLVFGPPMLFWTYKSAYPDPEPRTDANCLPTECLTCKTTIPAHADTCLSCGWSYKRR